MSVKYEEKEIITTLSDKTRLDAYKFCYKNLREGPNVISSSTLGELLKIFFPSSDIVMSFENVDGGCLTPGKRLIKKIKIITNGDAKTFEYHYAHIREFIINSLGISCSEVL